MFFLIHICDTNCEIRVPSLSIIACVDAPHTTLGVNRTTGRTHTRGIAGRHCHTHRDNLVDPRLLKHLNVLQD